MVKKLFTNYYVTPVIAIAIAIAIASDLMISTCSLMCSLQIG